MIAAVLLATVGAFAPLRAQQAGPPTVAPVDGAARARALELLEASARALGGRPLVVDATGVDARYTTRTRGAWQQARRWADTSSIIPATLRVAIDLPGRRGLREFDSVSPGEIRFNFRAVFDSAGIWEVDLLRWRNGTDVSRGGAAEAAAQQSIRERMFAHLAVRRALRADSTLRDAGGAVRGGRAVRVVTWTDPATRQPMRLELDSVTALPAAVSGERPGMTNEFLDYRPVDGVLVAHRVLVRVGEQQVVEQRVTRVSTRPVFDDATFAMPAGFVDAPARGQPRATRLAEGVYRLDDMPGGYHAAFVVGEEGIEVLEAPTSPQFTEAALAVMAAVAPGRGVTRVYVTHHHGDHVGGLAPYVARGAVVVVGAGLEDAVRRQLPDSLRGRVRFESVAGHRSFGAGTGRVDAYAVANTHADGNLAFHLPESGVLFQGDLFYIPERGAVPPAFPVTAALERVVRARRLRVSHVVGVHGRSGEWADVTRSLALRR